MPHGLPFSLHIRCDTKGTIMPRIQYLKFFKLWGICCFSVIFSHLKDACDSTVLQVSCDLHH